MSCENCGNENVKIINTVRNTYVCEKCGRDTESLFEIKLYKEIRNKAIDEFAEAIKSTLPIAVHRDCSEIDYEVDYALYGLRNRIDRIAEQMKEVGE